ncbi:T9SS type A sorting domain-containing protein [uncultured Psychroserpens sp.]|uniref:T9SS type A sorting domain-containing protein n=1 Tax=uncultured Psychroserpens sp. TaxID=255436 RepID=UPI00263321FF|nr:T9SS type A sorting domain-containing protein [uncultured Psychroserpens sp.]
MKTYYTIVLFSLLSFNIISATDYHVGPGQPLANISEVPWDALQAGDKIYIHWKSTPYYEKWVINAQGTAQNRIEIIGVSGPSGQKPIIDGNGAVTPTYLNYWNEVRGLIKIGGSSVPSDGLPSYITIENLELRSVRPAYTFTTDNGQTDTYASNAASIYIEKGEHIIIRDCIIHDSGNGIFIGANNGQSKDILIANNYIYDNGIVGSIFEHNTYTEALGITYEYNRFGPLRAGANGNNLKDRSAGLVVRYNWIESGNRQLDLVESGTSALYNDPSYSTTYVYGNILIEPNGAGNSQIIHYGGDNGTTSQYRKGDFYFYNNTVISTRNSNTTLARLSTQDETMHSFNNIIYTSNNGSSMAMINGDGTINSYYNWIKTNWVDSHSGSGTVNDQGNNLTGSEPLFVDFNNQDFNLQDTSLLIDAGSAIPSIHLPDHDVLNEYVMHTNSIAKQVVNTLDIGAFENLSALSVTDFPQERILLYPNPSTSLVFLKNIEPNTIKSIAFYSVSGQLVLTSTDTAIDVRAIASGIYFVKVNALDTQAIFRFIKQ